MKKKSIGLIVVACALALLGGMNFGKAVALDCNDVADCKSHWCFFAPSTTGCWAYINGQAWDDVHNATGSGEAKPSGGPPNTVIIASDCDDTCDPQVSYSSWCDVEPDAFYTSVTHMSCQ